MVYLMIYLKCYYISAFFYIPAFLNSFVKMGWIEMYRVGDGRGETLTLTVPCQFESSVTCAVLFQRICSHEVPSCPICLYPPTAAKITRCGHIFCWACILHYLSLSEKTWSKCPICYSSVHKKDLKRWDGDPFNRLDPHLLTPSSFPPKYLSMLQRCCHRVAAVCCWWYHYDAADEEGERGVVGFAQIQMDECRPSYSSRRWVLLT